MKTKISSSSSLITRHLLRVKYLQSFQISLSFYHLIMKFRYDFVSFLHSPCSVAALFFILSSIIPFLKAQDNEFFTECSKPFNCGAFKTLSFPFWGENRPQYCGQTEYWLNCSRNRQFPGIIINGEEFQVHEIHPFGNPQMMILSRPLNSLTGNDSCPITFNYSFFKLLNETEQTTLFRSCRESHRASQRIPCSTNGGESMFSFFGDDNVTELKINCPDFVDIPVQKRALEELNSGDLSLSDALAREFEVKYTAYDDYYCLICNKSGGICGTDLAMKVKFTCYCADGPDDTKCRGSVFNWEKLVMGMAGAFILVLLASVIALVLRKGKGRIRRLGVFMTTTKSDCDIEAFIRNYGTLAPKRYNFSDVKKMTNSYKEKLGQGGYGDVYKGNLPNGQIVAVKVLKESKGNGEEFINEVASISRTCHVNIVTLVGFCLKGNKRALIYEFMPNGSLEKFIFKESSTSLDLEEEEENKQKLGWEKLYHIALGVARGLEYLHRGCNTRIFHLDIKPQNILLDEEFCPKISDFGLSKLCTRKDSIVSMLEARGTIGYIAPEVFSRNFGAVSHKSDVYSYGMMVLEMVGGKKRNKVGASTSSEYFPDWVYKNLDELELEDQSVTPKAEIDTGKKMILVALWCIQTIPSNRPSINRVIEMLEGSVEALPIPPQPLFSSPPRLVPNSVTTSSFNSVSLLVD